MYQKVGENAMTARLSMSMKHEHEHERGKTGAADDKTQGSSKMGEEGRESWRSVEEGQQGIKRRKEQLDAMQRGKEPSSISLLFPARIPCLPTMENSFIQHARHHLIFS